MRKPPTGGTLAAYRITTESLTLHYGVGLNVEYYHHPQRLMVAIIGHLITLCQLAKLEYDMSKTKCTNLHDHSDMPAGRLL